MQLPKIIDVNAVEKYKISIHFHDGTEGIYDLNHLAGKGVFKAWDTDNNFYKVYVDEVSGAASWPGDIDIDTINVYCKIKGINAEEYLRNNRSYASYI